MTFRAFFRDWSSMINRNLTRGVKWIIFANIAVFLVEQLVIAPLNYDEGFLALFAQNPVVRFRGLGAEQFALNFNWLCPVQFFTYMFIHLNFWHLFWNLLALWFFGPPVEVRLGRREFLKFYLFTGFCAGALHGMVAPFFYGESYAEHYYMLGASGAIFGVLLAFAIYYPHQQVFLWFVLPMSSRLFVLLIGVFTFMSLLGSGGGGISYLTHLAGLGFGYLWIRLSELFPRGWLFNDDPRPFGRRRRRPDRWGGRWA